MQRQFRQRYFLLIIAVWYLVAPPGVISGELIRAGQLASPHLPLPHLTSPRLTSPLLRAEYTTPIESHLIFRISRPAKPSDCPGLLGAPIPPKLHSVLLPFQLLVGNILVESPCGCNTTHDSTQTTSPSPAHGPSYISPPTMLPMDPAIHSVVDQPYH